MTFTPHHLSLPHATLDASLVILIVGLVLLFTLEAAFAVWWFVSGRKPLPLPEENELDARRL